MPVFCLLALSGKAVYLEFMTGFFDLQPVRLT